MPLESGAYLLAHERDPRNSSDHERDEKRLDGPLDRVSVRREKMDAAEPWYISTTGLGPSFLLVSNLCLRRRTRKRGRPCRTGIIVLSAVLVERSVIVTLASSFRIFVRPPGYRAISGQFVYEQTEQRFSSPLLPVPLNIFNSPFRRDSPDEFRRANLAIDSSPLRFSFPSSSPR